MTPPKGAPGDLLSAAACAARRAYAPYSGYRVGAAIRVRSGAIVTGANVENASYGLTLCAERVAIGTAISHGLRNWIEMAIVVESGDLPVPCGACRQVLAEFCHAEFPLWVARVRHLRQAQRWTLGALLPHAFRLDSCASRSAPKGRPSGSSRGGRRR